MIWCGILKYISDFYINFNFFNSSSVDDRLLRIINLDFSSFLNSILIFGSGFICALLIYLHNKRTIKYKLTLLSIFWIPVFYILGRFINIIVHAENYLYEGSGFRWQSYREYMDDRLLFWKIGFIILSLFFFGIASYEALKFKKEKRVL